MSMTEDERVKEAYESLTERTLCLCVLAAGFIAHDRSRDSDCVVAHDGILMAEKTLAEIEARLEKGRE